MSADMAEVMAVVKEEQGQVAVLTEQGRLGTINISLPRQTVFIEVVADDEAAAEEAVRSLPMARWWTLDVFPTRVPPPPE